MSQRPHGKNGKNISVVNLVHQPSHKWFLIRRKWCAGILSQLVYSYLNYNPKMNFKEGIVLFKKWLLQHDKTNYKIELQRKCDCVK